MVDGAALGVPMEMLALRWVLTYALHSTILIAAVWLAGPWVRRLSLPTQEALWKAALLGGVLTASLHLGVGSQSPWGTWTLPAALDSTPAASRVATAEAPRGHEPVAQRHVLKRRAGGLSVTTIREKAVAAVAPPTQPTEPARAPSPWPWVLLGVVGLGSTVAIGRLFVASRRLKRRLAGRREVVEDPLLESFLTLCDSEGIPATAKKKNRVALTTTAEIHSPSGRSPSCPPTNNGRCWLTSSRM
jgi:hypothetical protein